MNDDWSSKGWTISNRYTLYTGNFYRLALAFFKYSEISYLLAGLPNLVLRFIVCAVSSLVRYAVCH
jgi:hypothetical protein